MSVSAGEGREAREEWEAYTLLNERLSIRIRTCNWPTHPVQTRHCPEFPRVRQIHGWC